MNEPQVFRFTLATDGLTSHAQPLTVRIDLTKEVEADQLRGQGERLASLLIASLPVQTIFALTDALVASGDDVYKQQQEGAR
jgi:hypothetical protein